MYCVPFQTLGDLWPYSFTKREGESSQPRGQRAAVEHLEEARTGNKQGARIVTRWRNTWSWCSVFFSSAWSSWFIYVFNNYASRRVMLAVRRASALWTFGSWKTCLRVVFEVFYSCEWTLIKLCSTELWFRSYVLVCCLTDSFNIMHRTPPCSLKRFINIDLCTWLFHVTFKVSLLYMTYFFKHWCHVTLLVLWPLVPSVV